jgi:hypothetical protein
VLYHDKERVVAIINRNGINFIIVCFVCDSSTILITIHNQYCCQGILICTNV